MSSAQAQTDAFLSGQGIVVDPSAIERTLLELWGPAAERVGTTEAEPHSPYNVTRIVLANLVVETTPDEAGRVGQALDEVVARFPCRAIVAIRDDSTGRSVAAEVAALCHLPAPGLPQVCSERILLKAGPDGVDMLPGAIRPLLEPDLPVVLWWTTDPRKAERLFRDLAEEATRIILDLDPTADPEALAFGLNPKLNPFARDTAWLGLTPWRELVAQCFEVPDRLKILGRLSSLEIKVSALDSHGPNLPRPAAWLAAWMAGQLGWTLEQVRPGDSSSAPFEARFSGKQGPIELKIHRQSAGAMAEPRLLEVALTAKTPEGDDTIHLRRSPASSSGVRVEICTPQTCELSRVIDLTELDGARRVAAGLESARHDAPFSKALPVALRLLGVPNQA